MVIETEASPDAVFNVRVDCAFASAAQLVVLEFHEKLVYEAEVLRNKNEVANTLEVAHAFLLLFGRCQL